MSNSHSSAIAQVQPTIWIQTIMKRKILSLIAGFASVGSLAACSSTPIESQQAVPAPSAASTTQPDAMKKDGDAMKKDGDAMKKDTPTKP